MSTNDVQYRSTKAHLSQFEEALANLSEEVEAEYDAAFSRIIGA